MKFWVFFFQRSAKLLKSVKREPSNYTYIARRNENYLSLPGESIPSETESTKGTPASILMSCEMRLPCDQKYMAFHLISMLRENGNMTYTREFVATPKVPVTLWKTCMTSIVRLEPFRLAIPCGCRIFNVGAAYLQNCNQEGLYEIIERINNHWLPDQETTNQVLSRN